MTEKVKNYAQEYQTIETIEQLLVDQTMPIIIRNNFFENSLIYPDPNDFEINKVCKHCGSKYKDEDAKEKYREAQNLYRKEDNRLYNLFKEATLLANDIKHDDKVDKMFGIAWERGHAYGMYEVYQCFEEMVPILK